MKYPNFFNRVIICVLSLSLLGCASIQQQQHQPPTEEVKNALTAVLSDCKNSLLSDDSLTPLIGKVALIDTRDTTVAMLTDESKPTNKERKAIDRWAEIKFECQKRILDVASHYAPPPVGSVLESGLNLGLGRTLELYSGHLTYAEYNTQVKEAASQMHAALSSVIRELQRQNAEAQQRAEIIANQQRQLFLQYLTYYNQTLQQQNSRLGGTITCTQLGNFTTCVTISE